MTLRLIWLAVLAWLALVGASLLWNWRQVDASVVELARMQAVSHFEKDLVYRRWVALQGGVYVPPTPSTPPNPHLSHLKNRDVTTTSGMALTLVNPAYMTRQVHELEAAKGGVRGHITSLRPLRPENAPDEWERQALRSFEAGGKEAFSLETLADGSYLRFMRPLVTEAPCLKCHEVQGYKVGDIRGGISVSVPFAPFAEIADRSHRTLLLGHGLIGLLGLTGFWLGGRRLQRSDQALRQSLGEAEGLVARQELLLSSLGEGVYGIDAAGNCIFINAYALDMLGFTRDEVVGQNPHRLFHSRREDGAPYPQDECPVYLTVRDGLRRDIEDAFFRKDRQCFPVSLIVTPIEHEGTIAGAIVAFNDISAQRKAEAALQEAVERLHSSFDAAAIGMALVSAKGRFVEVNPALCRIVGYSADELKQKTFQEITHPDDLEADLAHKRELIAGEATSYQMEKRYLHRDGHTVWILLTASTVRDGRGRLLYFVAQIQDVTEQKKVLEQVQQLAYFDALTGLPNRRLLLDRLDHALSQAKRFERPLAVLFLDLDDFKTVNDTIGHDVGDELLKQVAVRLEGCVRRGDTVARQGGDEFIIVLAEIAKPEDAARVAAKIVAAVDKPMHVAGHSLRVTTSVGIAVYPTSGTDEIQELLKRADRAMYAAKAGGRNGYRVYTEEMASAAS